LEDKLRLSQKTQD